MQAHERFFEANFYSQVAAAWHPAKLVWFTPDTVYEAQYGFDTFVELGGSFLFFQFKDPKNRRQRKKLCQDGGHTYLQAFAAHDQLVGVS